SGKQGGVPCTQPFCSQWLVVVARSVKHHFDHALDMSVGRLQCTDIYAEATSNRGPDLFDIQLLALDFTALDHIGGEGLERGLLAEAESEGFHVACETPLSVADTGQSLR